MSFNLSRRSQFNKSIFIIETPFCGIVGQALTHYFTKVLG